jgi:phage terminase small subunit
VKPRKILFAEAYAGPAQGNGQEAARIAGYKGTNASLMVTASRLLRDPAVIERIANLSEKVAKAAAQEVAAACERAEVADRPKIADAAERRSILSAMLRDLELNPAARVRAADVLNKMDGIYVQRVEHSGAIAVQKSKVLRSLPAEVLERLDAEAVH